MDELCSGLRQEDIENLSAFVAEVNMHRAHQCQSAIAMDDAMNYLKASRFNASKAIDIYKNYQKHREAYGLDNLRPYREPLSSEIGSNKLQILDTQDPEGSPLLLFSGSKHDKSSDLKASMQLLFYSLDQVAEKWQSQERGVVFIMDMKDVNRSSFDPRYLHNMMLVLTDGYPVCVKMIYIVSAPLWLKTQVTITKTFKHQSKVKFISYSDISQYFSLDQLPPSLGGTYSPTHTPSHAHATPSPKLHPPKRSPATRGIVRRTSEPLIGGGGRKENGHAHKKAVNDLVGIFEHKTKPLHGGGGATASSSVVPSPFHPKSHLHPPSQNKPTKPAPPPSRPRSGSAGKTALKPVAPGGAGAGAYRSRQLEESEKIDSSPKFPHVQLRSTGAPLWGVKQGDKPHASKQPPLRPTGGLQKQESAPSKPQTSPARQPLIPPAILKARHQSGSSSTPSSTHSSSPHKPTFSPPITTTSAASITTSPSAPSQATVPSSTKISSGATRGASGGVGKRIHNFQRQASSNASSGGSSSHSTDLKTSTQSPFSGDRFNVSERVAMMSSQIPPQDKFSQSWNETNKKASQQQSNARAPDQKENKVGRFKRALMPLKLRRDKSGASEDRGDNGNSASTETSQTQTSKSQKQETASQAASRLAVGRLGSQEAKKKELTSPTSKDDRQVQQYENVVTRKVDTPVSDAYENIDFSPPPPPPHATKPERRDHENATKPERRDHENATKPEKRDHESATKPERRDYENIDILPYPGALLHHDDYSSEEEACLGDVEDFSGPPEEAIYENYGPDEGNRIMTPEEIEKHISLKGKLGLSAEYLKIKNEPLFGLYRACRLPCNLGKNRYKDVVCYDDTRVVLKSVPGIEGSDYIHANFVSGCNKPNAFILTQGATKKTVVDFWRMVWEKHVFVVVMITKCVELGKHKCVQYWPDEGTKTFGSVSVQVAKMQNCEGFDVRTFKVQRKGVERTIMHFQFLAWPDYGVPDSGTSVIQLVMAVREMQAKYGKINPSLSASASKDGTSFPPYGPPIVVHCSAGVGRSGAFCALDYCIDELNSQKKVNLQGVVRKLRMQRAFSIQTDEQYAFCYRTVVEYAKSSHKYTKKY